MADAGGKAERSWLPLALAGGFVAFSVLVAVLASARDGEGDPSTARTVFDVAELTVVAVQDNDTAMYADLQCEVQGDVLAPYVGGDATATANHSDVTGIQTGAFRLTIEGDGATTFDVVVEQDGDRSCISSVKLTQATR